jgi:hypothetical protein
MDHESGPYEPHVLQFLCPMGSSAIDSTTLMQTFAWVRRSCSDPVWVMYATAICKYSTSRGSVVGCSRGARYSLLPPPDLLRRGCWLVGGVTASCFCEIPGRVCIGPACPFVSWSNTTLEAKRLIFLLRRKTRVLRSEQMGPSWLPVRTALHVTTIPQGTLHRTKQGQTFLIWKTSGGPTS